MSFDRASWQADMEARWAKGLVNSTDNGKIGVRVQIIIPEELRARLLKETDWDNKDPIKEVVDSAMYDAREGVWAALQRAEMMLDPKTAEYAEATRQALIKAFEDAGCGPIFMEQIPNEYEPQSHWSLRSPWYQVTTRLGHFKVGWRKRVINLDWSKTTVKMAGDELTDEDITKGQVRSSEPYYIHCYGYGKLTEYLKKLGEVKV